jgi:hypothetical protein
MSGYVRTVEKSFTVPVQIEAGILLSVATVELK